MLCALLYSIVTVISIRLSSILSLIIPPIILTVLKARGLFLFSSHHVCNHSYLLPSSLSSSLSFPSPRLRSLFTLIFTLERWRHEQRENVLDRENGLHMVISIDDNDGGDAVIDVSFDEGREGDRDRRRVNEGVENADRDLLLNWEAMEVDQLLERHTAITANEAGCFSEERRTSENKSANN